MSDDDLVTCPVDGCDYKGGMKAVKGHWGGSQDAEHQGAFHKAIEQAQNDSTDGSSDGSNGDSTDAHGNSGGRAGGLTFPEADSEGDGGCPKCGGEMETVPAHKRFVTDDGTKGETEGGEEYCEQCGILVDGGEVYR